MGRTAPNGRLAAVTWHYCSQQSDGFTTRTLLPCLYLDHRRPSNIEGPPGRTPALGTGNESPRPAGVSTCISSAVSFESFDVFSSVEQSTGDVGCGVHCICSKRRSRRGCFQPMTRRLKQTKQTAFCRPTFSSCALSLSTRTSTTGRYSGSWT